MLKEMLMSKFETYLLDEVEVEDTEHNETEEEQHDYPPGFFTAL